MKKTVITYGTFDMFHIGHLNLINNLRKNGDKVIIGISTDEFNEVKGKKTLIPFEQRKKIVESIKGVDLVIAESNWEQKIEDIKKYNVDIFIIGNDWEGKFDYLKEYCDVVYVNRTENISTTQLKKSLTNFLSIPKEDIINALEILEQLKKDFE